MHVRGGSQIETVQGIASHTDEATGAFGPSQYAAVAAFLPAVACDTIAYASR